MSTTASSSSLMLISEFMAKFQAVYPRHLLDIRQHNRPSSLRSKPSFSLGPLTINPHLLFELSTSSPTSAGPSQSHTMNQDWKDDGYESEESSMTPDEDDDDDMFFVSKLASSSTPELVISNRPTFNERSAWSSYSSTSSSSSSASTSSESFTDKGSDANRLFEQAMTFSGMSRHFDQDGNVTWESTATSAGHPLAVSEGLAKLLKMLE